MGLTRGGIESVFGPKLFEVTECGAENLQSADPIEHYILRVLFHDHPSSNARGFTLQLLLRSEMANIEYSAGRDSLFEYLADQITNTHHYFRAIHHFTASIGQLWQFFDLNRSKHEQRTGNLIDIYKPNGESVLEKLNILHNVSKHAAVDYESMTQPVWITNSGIASKEAELFFYELKETLEQVSKWCLDFLDPAYRWDRGRSARD